MKEWNGNSECGVVDWVLPLSWCMELDYLVFKHLQVIFLETTGSPLQAHFRMWGMRLGTCKMLATDRLIYVSSSCSLESSNSAVQYNISLCLVCYLRYQNLQCFSMCSEQMCPESPISPADSDCTRAVSSPLLQWPRHHRHTV